MEAFGMFLVKSAVWLTGFTLIYLVFLRNERYFGLNRAFLLSGIFASILFPLFTWHYAVVLPPLPVEEISAVPEVTEEVTYIAPAAPKVPFYWWIYILGIVCLALRLILQTVQVVKRLRKSGYEKNGSIKLVRTPEYSASFSFFSFVFVNPSTSDIEAQEIVNHESGHIQNRHWFDLLLMEFLRILQWFNPFVWVYARLVRQNHEYLADKIALRRTSDPAVYQAALLNQMFGVPVISLANSFSSSLNNKRFTMMKKKIHSPFRKLKLLMALPLIALVFYAFAKPEYVYQEQLRQDNKLYCIDRDSVGISFNSQFERKDLADIQIKLAEMNIEINYTFLKFSDQGKLQQISASIKYPDGTGGSFSSTELTPTSGPGFRRKLPLGTASFFGKVPDNSSKYNQEEISSNKKELSKFTILIETTDDKIKLTSIEGCAWKELSFNIPLSGTTQAIDQNGMTQNKTKEESANSSFLFTISKTDDGLRLGGIKGTAFKFLTFSCSGNCRQAINQNGMTRNESSLKKEEGIGLEHQPKSLIGNLDHWESIPLFVLDGEVVSKNVIEKLEPANIKSVSVLKNESATALYGEKGKDGVILISTKESSSLNSTSKSFNDVTVIGYGSGRPLIKNGQTVISVRDGKVEKIIPSGQDTSYKFRSPVAPFAEVDKPFVNVEEMPQFPGGQKELMKFIQSNLHYPSSAKETGVAGTVIVQFIIKSDGKVDQIKVMRGIGSGCDEEAVRVIKSMPDWIPGRQGGKPVDVYYTLPFRFASSQNNSFQEQKPTIILEQADSQNKSSEELKPYVTVEQMPEFPGGQKELMKFIQGNLKYPVEAQTQRIQGTVIIQFVVMSTGKLDHLKVIRGVNPLLDEEALRVLKQSPEWIPGKQGGKPVPVYYTLPFRFLLPGNNPSRENAEKAGAVWYNKADEKPQFPGGMKAMQNFLIRNFKFPVVALEQGIDGNALISFIVDKTGKIKDVHPINNADPSLGSEAVRVISKMPDFIPGKQGGKTVDVTCLIPIRFINKLSGKTSHGFLNGDFPETLVIGMGSLKSSPTDKRISSFQAEANPIFPGPYPFSMYIRQNLKYPVNALKEKIEGKVQVFFTVSSKGKVENVRVIYGKYTEFNTEAMRVVHSMPNWIPGKRNGKPVDVNFTTWVEFNLQSKSSSYGSVQEFSPLKGEPYTIVEEMPKFPTGNKGFWNFIASHLKYPEKAKRNNIQGTVYVSFVVNSKGGIEKAKITHSIDPEMDAEALRIINSMPNLIPGKIKGKQVDVKMTVPVKFALESGEQSSTNA